MTVTRLPSAVRPSAARRLPVTLLALLAAALVVAGCGDPVPDSNAPEGTSVAQDGISYFVQDSRALNPEDPVFRLEERQATRRHEELAPASSWRIASVPDGILA